jgi:hypothetical protein
MVRVPIPFFHDARAARLRRRRNNWTRPRRQPRILIPLPDLYDGLYLMDRRGRRPHRQYLMVWNQRVNRRRIATWEPTDQLAQDGWIYQMDQVDAWVVAGRPRTFRGWAQDQGFL